MIENAISFGITVYFTTLVLYRTSSFENIVCFFSFNYRSTYILEQPNKTIIYQT